MQTYFCVSISHVEIRCNKLLMSVDFGMSAYLVFIIFDQTSCTFLLLGKSWKNSKMNDIGHFTETPPPYLHNDKWFSLNLYITNKKSSRHISHQLHFLHLFSTQPSLFAQLYYQQSMIKLVSISNNEKNSLKCKIHWTLN